MYDQGNFYRRKRLVGDLLTVSEVYFIIIMAGSMGANRHGTQDVAKRHILSCTQRERQAGRH